MKYKIISQKVPVHIGISLPKYDQILSDLETSINEYAKEGYTVKTMTTMRDSANGSIYTVIMELDGKKNQ